MAKMRYARHQRHNRYLAYRHEHFLPEEAKELSQLKSLQYWELGRMVRQRRRMWEDFKADATGRGWSAAKAESKWRARVRFWYVDNGYVEKDYTFGALFKEANIWFWFRDVSGTLPPEKRYPTDYNGKNHRSLTDAERESKAQHAVQKAQNDKFIDGLIRTAAKSPQREASLLKQAQRLGYTGKSLLTAARRRGYL